jgi:hydrogenase maturation protease
MPGKDTRCRVIGIGNPDRGDDAAGRAVARRLRGLLPPSVDIVEQDGEASTLLACLENAATAYVIDACASGAPAGTVRRFDVRAAPLPPDAFTLSTHDLGLAAAIELARALGQLPPRCFVFAIEAGRFAPGGPLSPPVAAAIAKVTDLVCAEIDGTDVPEGRIDA